MRAATESARDTGETKYRHRQGLSGKESESTGESLKTDRWDRKNSKDSAEQRKAHRMHTADSALGNAYKKNNENIFKRNRNS